MSGDILSSICIEIFAESTKFSKIDPFVKAYEQWFREQEFSVLPYSASSAAKFLGPNSSNPKEIDLEKAKPLIYFLHHHSDIDVRSPTKLDANIVLDDHRVLETLSEYERRDSNAPKDDNIAKFHSSWLDTRFVYALTSPRIKEDDAENEDLLDGEHPVGAVGFFSIDSDGVLDGRAFLKYDNRDDLVENGNWRLDGKIFVDPDDRLFFFYKLNREPFDKSDRSGYMRLERERYSPPVNKGQAVLSGIFVDDDTLAEKNKGRVYVEGVTADFSELMETLKSMASLLMQKI